MTYQPCATPTCLYRGFFKFPGSDGLYCRKCIRRHVVNGPKRQSARKLCRCGCGRTVYAKGLAGPCYREKNQEIARRHETGDGSRQAIGGKGNPPIEFHPKDEWDRRLCLESLTERGVQFEERDGVIWWREGRAA